MPPVPDWTETLHSGTKKKMHVNIASMGVWVVNHCAVGNALREMQVSYDGAVYS